MRLSRRSYVKVNEFENAHRINTQNTIILLPREDAILQYFHYEHAKCHACIFEMRIEIFVSQYAHTFGARKAG